MQRRFCLHANDTRPTHRKSIRSAGIPALGAMLLLAVAASIGCDSNSFVPSRPEELSGTGTVTTVPLKDAPSAPASLEIASVRAVEIVLAPRDGDEAEIWKNAARTQSGHEKIKVKLAIPAADQAQLKQIELIRESMARHPRVLVVEPVDPTDSDLAHAVAETRGQGIPVVLVGRPLTGANKALATAAASATAPLVLVAPPPFASSAHELVAAAIRNAKAAELDPNGGALIVVNTLGDQFISERVAEIQKALKTAGITSVEEIRFADDAPTGEKLVKESLKAHPKVAMIFSVDYESTLAIRNLMNGKSDVPLFVSGCYTLDTNMQDLGNQLSVAAAVEFTPVRLLRKAISTAVSLAQGKVISSPVELSVVVDDRPLHAVGLRAAVANAKKAAEHK
jgi:ABC-type sugar transport system substrate-binding protein